MSVVPSSVAIDVDLRVVGAALLGTVLKLAVSGVGSGLVKENPQELLVSGVAAEIVGME